MYVDKLVLWEMESSLVEGNELLVSWIMKAYVYKISNIVHV